MSKKKEKYLSVEERANILYRIFETPGDHGATVRCLKEILTLSDREFNRLNLLNLVDTANSLSLRWDHFIDKEINTENDEPK